MGDGGQMREVVVVAEGEEGESVGVVGSAPVFV